MHKGRKKDNVKYDKIIQRLNCFNEIQLKPVEIIYNFFPLPQKKKRKETQKIVKDTRCLRTCGLETSLSFKG